MGEILQNGFRNLSTSMPNVCKNNLLGISRKPERKAKEPYHFKKYLVRNQKVNKQSVEKMTYHISLSINLGPHRFTV
uniref:Putative ovule protein n=1 Tax=Solanum chacoense TaxID=4108 RepID=A0A0V0H2Q6_SOLCH